jgi:hypothetical protein
MGKRKAPAPRAAEASRERTLGRIAVIDDPPVHPAAIVGPIIITSLGVGGFPAALAMAVALTGAMVILMMVWEGWP